MPRIKLLFISQATGGVKRHITYLASRLDSRQFEIVGCFSPRDHIKGVSPNKESYADAFNQLGLRVIPLEMYREINPLRDGWSFLKLLRILTKEKWDIVHTHSSKAGFLGRIAARLAGVPVIVHTPNAFAFDRPLHPFRNLLYVFLERLAGFFCDALIAVSPSEEELARKVVSPEKTRLICNGIDLKEFDFTLDPRTKKKMLGLPEDKPMVLTIGRFAHQKSPGIFIVAAKKVLAQRKDVFFVMVGDGPLLSQVKEKVVREGLQRSIPILAWRPDAKEIIAACDVYVLSSLWEGLPYTVLEAMALRKPVVATAARGTRDVVREGVNGFLVSFQDPETMAHRILKLLHDGELAKRMGEAGRAMVEKEFLLEPKIQKTASLYLELLKRKRPGT